MEYRDEHGTDETARPFRPTNGRQPSETGMLLDMKRRDGRGMGDEDRPDQGLDEVARAAVVTAMDLGGCDELKCLIDLHQNESGDALFHAVSLHDAQAVRSICENLAEDIKLSVINGYPSGDYFPIVITPLLLACKSDDLEIIKILLDHGAKMPLLDDLLCRAHGDSYLRFLAVVEWYEASSSQAYILLSSDDPMDTIFKLGNSLQEAEDSLNVPFFNQESERLQGKLADLGVRLLSLARNNQEIGVLLRGGQEELQQPPTRPSVPLRIQQALEMDSFKKFVCHPSSQGCLTEQWEVSKPKFLTGQPGIIKSYVFHIMVMLLYPILCLGYILLPCKRMAFMKRPKIRFLVHAASRLTFLCLLILSTESKIVSTVVNQNQSDVIGNQLIEMYVAAVRQPFTGVYIVILLWVVGMTVRAMKQMWNLGASFYFTNRWTILDFVQLVLYWLSVAMTIISVVQETSMLDKTDILVNVDSSEEVLLGASSSNASLGTTDAMSFLGATVTEEYESANETQRTWDDFRVKLVAESAFAVANVLSFLQVLHHLTALSLLGPLLISFRGMICDVLKFFVIFGFLLVSFSIGMTQLYCTFQALDVRMCLLRGVDCPETPFLSFGQSMRTLFWSLFDMVDLDSLKVNADVVLTETLGNVMYAAFMLVGTIVLLNALIAMMSNTYTRVEENVEIEWKISCSRIMVEYITETATLPPPFNLVPPVKSLIWFFRSLRNTLHQCHGQDHVPSLNKDGRECQHATYKRISRAVGERCLLAIHIDMKQSKSKSDVTSMVETINKLSSDVAAIKSYLDSIMGNVNPIPGDRH